MLHLTTYLLRLGSLDGLIHSLDEKASNQRSIKDAFVTALDLDKQLKLMNKEVKLDIRRAKEIQDHPVLFSLLRIQRDISERIEVLSHKVFDLNNRSAEKAA